MLMLAVLAVAGTLAGFSVPDQAARPIRLAEAVDLARRNAPQVIQAEGQSRVNRAAVRSAKAAFLPSLSVSAGASRRVPAGGSQTRIGSDGQVITLPPEPWSYNLGYSANLSLFEGGRRFYELRGANARAEAALVNEVTQRYAVTLTVKQQFFNALAARESILAAEAQEEQADQQLKAALARVRARVATRSDSLRSVIQLSTARLALMDARESAASADAALTRLVGSDTPVTAAPLDSLEVLTLPFSADSLLSLAEAGPDVREARASLDAARQTARIAWTDYFPSLSVGYSRSGSGSSESFELNPSDYAYNGSVRFSLSLPLFNQLSREQQVVQSRVALRNAEVALRDATLAARESLTQSLGTYRSADERLSTLTTSVQAAEEDLRVQQQRYAFGSATVLDVLTSQTQLAEARRNLIRARYDLRVARAQLEALIGRDL